MVWPILPLVLEGLLRPSLAASAAVAALLGVKGSLLWPLGAPATLIGIGLLVRARRAALGPATVAASRCSCKDHEERVKAAAEAAQQPGPLRMFKATASNTFRPQQIATRKRSAGRLDLSRFVHVLEINTEELWCDIEASATFETFAAEALAAGTVPLVIPELRSITVGGAVVGIGLESSSFRYGFFHDGLIEADILLASGEVVTARPTGEHAELFRAIPNSLGSFGYLLRLRMKVRRAQPYVRFEKVWFSSPEALVKGCEVASGDAANDFVDAVALGEQGGMVMTAKFVAEVPAGQAAKTYGFWPQFYPSIVHEGVEYMSTTDYIWRWDADWFWCTQIFPGLTMWWVRFLCGPDTLRSNNYKIFNDAMISHVAEPLGRNKNEELIVQDIEIPLERSAEWIREFLKVVPSIRMGKIKLTRPGLPEAVPIWLCPITGTDSPLMPMKPGKLYINFGFWDSLTGPETEGGMKTGRINRALEALCAKMDGKKTLYSAAYFTEEEFHAQYNGDLYRKIKAQYDPHGRIRGWYERLMRA
uniref:Delta(24)-sterol reductase n=2 Tax=Alexandrium monilatum TaxID=311494 RepID=A0A7S4SXR8_9DINO